jgi:uncharacterized membrane protein
MHKVQWLMLATSSATTQQHHSLFLLITFFQCLTSSSCKYLAAQMFARRSNQVAEGPRSKTQVLASKLQVLVINTTTN